MKQIISLVSASVLAISSFSSLASDSLKQSEIKPATDLAWGYLNPLRGDKSPGAKDLWGDRTENVATGMLVKFNPGFSSPPHIHNITYRGIVIEGLMHNDDPKAETMWLPAGSFWTQPAGEDHITAANAQSNMIYLEIDSGPYLVKPSAQKFDNGERPVNIHSSNIVWLSESESTLVSGEGIKLAHLWRNQTSSTRGMLIKLNENAKGHLFGLSDEFKAVVIQGLVNYKSDETKQAVKLHAGSFFSSKGEFEHELSTEGEAIIYIRTDEKLKAEF